jgi:hypothetical protein
VNPLLIGMNNPYGQNPRYALYPMPENSAGGLLYDMVREATGLTPPQYIEMFDRINIVDGEWNRRRAAANAVDLIRSLAGRNVVLLGRKVQEAFGLYHSDRGPITEIRKVTSLLPRGEATFHCIPHPSGRNPWYNDPENRQLVKNLLARLHEGRNMSDEPAD